MCCDRNKPLGRCGPKNGPRRALKETGATPQEIGQGTSEVWWFRFLRSEKANCSFGHICITSLVRNLSVDVSRYKAT